MQENVDGVQQVMSMSKGWYSWVPFAALAVKDAAPANRPMLTRLLEQMLVGVIAGGGSSFATFNAMIQKQETTQAAQAVQISTLKEQLRDTEIRLTQQIVELRSRQLK